MTVATLLLITIAITCFTITFGIANCKDNDKQQIDMHFVTVMLMMIMYVFQVKITKLFFVVQRPFIDKRNKIFVQQATKIFKLTL